MSLQQYLNNDVLATTSETVSGTLTTINVFAVPITMAKSGDVVIIINKGTGRQYPVTLTADLDTSLDRITFSSTTFDTPIPEGSIVIQKQQTKYENLLRKYTTVNIPIYASKVRSSNDFLRDDNVPAAFTNDSSSTFADGSSVDADFASLYSVFLTPPNGARIEHITYTANLTGSTNRNCSVLLFELPIAQNNNSSQTISLIESQSFTSQNDATYNFYVKNSTTHALASNTCVLPVFRATGQLDQSVFYNIIVQLLISFDPRQ
tara:strand:+ start:229 stop:1017 length:789 start_codon:yes stop_codon:yes gene_type:complete